MITNNEDEEKITMIMMMRRMVIIMMMMHSHVSNTPLGPCFIMHRAHIEAIFMPKR